MMLQISAEIRHSAGQFLMEYLFSRHSGFQGCDSKTLQLLVLDTLWNIAICWVFNWINTKIVKTLHKKINFFLDFIWWFMYVIAGPHPGGAGQMGEHRWWNLGKGDYYYDCLPLLLPPSLIFLSLLPIGYCTGEKPASSQGLCPSSCCHGQRERGGVWRI